MVRVELVEVSREMLPTLSELHVSSWQIAYRGMISDAYLDAMSADRWLTRWQELFATKRSDECAILADGKIVGLCILGRSRDDEQQVGEVWAFYLHPKAWGKGYADAAMQQAVNRLRHAGYTSASLWVLEANVRARRFYERVGFVWDGSRKQITVGGEDLWEVRYRLSL